METTSAPHAAAPWRAGLGLFGACFCVFFLTTSREAPEGEGKAIHQVAESILLRGELSVPERSASAVPGRGGRLYSVAPLAPSLIHLPGVVFDRVAASWWPEASAGVHALASHLGPALLGALTCWLFFHLALSLGIGVGAASLGTLFVALGSTVWISARSPLPEALQTACFTGLFAELLRARTTRAGVRLGAWAAVLLNTKLAFALALPGAVLFLWFRAPRDRRAVLLGAAGPLLAGILLALAYNYWRWGLLVPGALGAVFTERFATGLWGMFLSPGKGLLLFCPLLLLALVGLPRLFRRHVDVAWAFLATAVPVILLHAPMTFWSGEGWGPRHVLFAVPALLVPAALVIDDVVKGRRFGWLAAVALVFVTSFSVQLAGLAVSPQSYERIAEEARSPWLGVPNRQGATPWNQGGPCGPCFEDAHPVVWLPPFNPIEGHIWLGHHLRQGDDWLKAEADAPWHRYTKLKLDFHASYAAARIDWWYLDFFPRFPRAALSLMLPMVIGMLAGAVLLLQGLRRRA